MAVATKRWRKLESLSPEEVKSFKKYVKSFLTKTDVLEKIDITRPTLNSILKKGTGHSRSLAKVREALKNN